MVEIRKIEEVWGGVDIPEITGVYDPLSGLRDGTITYSEGKVVVALPELKPGEYRPAVILKGDEKKVYVLPMRWVVRGRWRR